MAFFDDYQTAQAFTEAAAKKGWVIRGDDRALTVLYDYYRAHQETAGPEEFLRSITEKDIHDPGERSSRIESVLARVRQDSAETADRMEGLLKKEVSKEEIDLKRELFEHRGKPLERADHTGESAEERLKREKFVYDHTGLFGGYRSPEVLGDSFPEVKRHLYGHRDKGKESPAENSMTVGHYLLWLLATREELTPDQLVRMTKDELKEMSKDFVSEVKAHPINNLDGRELSSEELHANAAWYGEIYAKGFLKFKDYTLPGADRLGTGDNIMALREDAVSDLLSFLGGLAYTSSPWLFRGSKYDDVALKRFGPQPEGTNRRAAFRNSIEKNVPTSYQHFMNALRNSFFFLDKAADVNYVAGSYTLQIRAAAKFLLEAEYLPLMGGKGVMAADEAEQRSRLKYFQGFDEGNDNEELKDFTDAECAKILDTPLPELREKDPELYGRAIEAFHQAIPAAERIGEEAERLRKEREERLKNEEIVAMRQKGVDRILSRARLSDALPENAEELVEKILSEDEREIIGRTPLSVLIHADPALYLKVMYELGAQFSYDIRKDLREEADRVVKDKLMGENGWKYPGDERLIDALLSLRDTDAQNKFKAEAGINARLLEWLKWPLDGNYPQRDRNKRLEAVLQEHSGADGMGMEYDVKALTREVDAQKRDVDYETRHEYRESTPGTDAEQIDRREMYRTLIDACYDAEHNEIKNLFYDYQYFKSVGYKTISEDISKIPEKERTAAQEELSDQTAIAEFRDRNRQGRRAFRAELKEAGWKDSDYLAFLYDAAMLLPDDKRLQKLLDEVRSGKNESFPEVKPDDRLHHFEMRVDLLRRAREILAASKTDSREKRGLLKQLEAEEKEHEVGLRAEKRVQQFAGFENIIALSNIAESMESQKEGLGELAEEVSELFAGISREAKSDYDLRPGGEPLVGHYTVDNAFNTLSGLKYGNLAVERYIRRADPDHPFTKSVVSFLEYVDADEAQRVKEMLEATRKRTAELNERVEKARREEVEAERIAKEMSEGDTVQEEAPQNNIAGEPQPVPDVQTGQSEQKPVQEQSQTAQQSQQHPAPEPQPVESRPVTKVENLERHPAPRVQTLERQPAPEAQPVQQEPEQPDNSPILLDEFEAQVYDHIMFNRPDKAAMARILVNVQEDISRGDLLVRKDLPGLVINMLPGDERQELIDEIYALRMEIMKGLGRQALEGRYIRDYRSSVRDIEDYESFRFFLQGAVVRDILAPDQLSSVDTIGELLHWNKAEFTRRAEAWLKQNGTLGNRSWEEAQEDLRMAHGLRIAMQIDGNALDGVFMFKDARSREAIQRFIPTQSEVRKKFVDSNAKDREALVREIRRFGERADELRGRLMGFDEEFDHTDNTLLGKLYRISEFQSDSNKKLTYADLFSLIQGKDMEGKSFRDYSEAMKKLPNAKPELLQTLEDVDRLAKDILSAFYQYMQKGMIPEKTRELGLEIQYWDEMVAYANNRMREYDEGVYNLEKDRKSALERLEKTRANKEKAEEKQRKYLEGFDERLAGAKKQRKLSDRELTRPAPLNTTEKRLVATGIEVDYAAEQAMAEIKSSNRLSPKDMRRYINSLGQVNEIYDTIAFSRLMSMIRRGMTAHRNIPELDVFREESSLLERELDRSGERIDKTPEKERPARIMEESLKFKARREAWIIRLQGIMEKYNDIGLAADVYQKTMQQIQDALPKKKKEKGKVNEHSEIRVSEGGYQNERRSFAQLVYGYVETVGKYADNSFNRPFRNAFGEEAVVMEALRRLEKTLREQVPGFRDAKDFPVPNYASIEALGLESYIAQLDRFLIANLRSKAQVSALEGVSNALNIHRMSLEDLAPYEEQMKKLIIEKLRKKEHSLDEEKYLANEYRRRLIRAGIPVEGDVRGIKSYTELEVWYEDVAAQCIKAYRTGMLDKRGDLFNATQIAGNRDLQSYKKTWAQKRPSVYKETYRFKEDSMKPGEKKDLTLNIESSWLHNVLRMEEFLPKELEMEIGTAAKYAGYNEMTRWNLAKKVVVFGMGHEGKTLEQMLALSPKERGELARRFGAAVREHPFSGPAAADLTAAQRDENAAWYGVMYGNLLKQLRSGEIRFFPAHSSDHPESARKVRNMEYLFFQQMTQELLTSDLKSLVGSDAAKKNKSNPYGRDARIAFREGFESIRGKGSHEQDKAFAVNIRSLMRPYNSGISDPRDSTPSMKKLFFKLIAQYEMEPKLSGTDLIADKDTEALFKEVAENTGRAWEYITSDKSFGRLLKDLNSRLQLSEKEIGSMLELEKPEEERLLSSGDDDPSFGSRYQEVLRFMARNIPGIPEIVKTVQNLERRRVEERPAMEAEKMEERPVMEAETMEARPVMVAEDLEKRPITTVENLERQSEEEATERKAAGEAAKPVQERTGAELEAWLGRKFRKFVGQYEADRKLSGISTDEFLKRALERGLKTIKDVEFLSNLHEAMMHLADMQGTREDHADLLMKAFMDKEVSNGEFIAGVRKHIEVLDDERRRNIVRSIPEAIRDNAVDDGKKFNEWEKRVSDAAWEEYGKDAPQESAFISRDEFFALAKEKGFGATPYEARYIRALYDCLVFMGDPARREALGSAAESVVSLFRDQMTSKRLITTAASTYMADAFNAYAPRDKSVVRKQTGRINRRIYLLPNTERREFEAWKDGSLREAWFGGEFRSRIGQNEADRKLLGVSTDEFLKRALERGLKTREDAEFLSSLHEGMRYLVSRRGSQDDYADLLMKAFMDKDVSNGAFIAAVRKYTSVLSEERRSSIERSIPGNIGVNAEDDGRKLNEWEKRVSDAAWEEYGKDAPQESAFISREEFFALAKEKGFSMPYEARYIKDLYDCLVFMGDPDRREALGGAAENVVSLFRNHQASKRLITTAASTYMSEAFDSYASRDRDKSSIRKQIDRIEGRIYLLSDSAKREFNEWEAERAEKHVVTKVANLERKPEEAEKAAVEAERKAGEEANLWAQYRKGLEEEKTHLRASQFYNIVESLEHTPEVERLARVMWNIENHERNHSALGAVLDVVNYYSREDNREDWRVQGLSSQKAPLTIRRLLNSCRNAFLMNDGFDSVFGYEYPKDLHFFDDMCRKYGIDSGIKDFGDKITLEEKRAIDARRGTVHFEDEEKQKEAEDAGAERLDTDEFTKAFDHVRGTFGSEINTGIQQADFIKAVYDKGFQSRHEAEYLRAVYDGIFNMEPNGIPARENMETLMSALMDPKLSKEAVYAAVEKYIDTADDKDKKLIAERASRVPETLQPDAARLKDWEDMRDAEMLKAAFEGGAPSVLGISKERFFDMASKKGFKTPYEMRYVRAVYDTLVYLTEQKLQGAEWILDAFHDPEVNKDLIHMAVFHHAGYNPQTGNLIQFRGYDESVESAYDVWERKELQRAKNGEAGKIEFPEDEQPVEENDKPPVNNEQPGEQPVGDEQPVEQPVGGNQEQPVEQPVGGNQEQPVEQPVGGNQEQPVEQPVEVNQEQPVEQPVEVNQEQPAEQPVEVNQEQPAEQPVEVNQEQPAEQPVEVNQEQPVEQPVEVNQEQPVEQPVEVNHQQPAEPVETRPKTQVLNLERHPEPEPNLINDDPNEAVGNLPYITDFNSHLEEGAYRMQEGVRPNGLYLRGIFYNMQLGNRPGRNDYRLLTGAYRFTNKQLEGLFAREPLSRVKAVKQIFKSQGLEEPKQEELLKFVNAPEFKEAVDNITHIGDARILYNRSMNFFGELKKMLDDQKTAQKFVDTWRDLSGSDRRAAVNAERHRMVFVRAHGEAIGAGSEKPWNLLSQNQRDYLLHPEKLETMAAMLETKKHMHIVNWNSGEYNDARDALKDLRRSIQELSEFISRNVDENGFGSAFDRGAYGVNAGGKGAAYVDDVFRAERGLLEKLNIYLRKVTKGGDLAAGEKGILDMTQDAGAARLAGARALYDYVGALAEQDIVEPFRRDLSAAKDGQHFHVGAKAQFFTDREEEIIRRGAASVKKEKPGQGYNHPERLEADKKRELLKRNTEMNEKEKVRETSFEDLYAKTFKDAKENGTANAHRRAAASAQRGEKVKKEREDTQKAMADFQLAAQDAAQHLN